MTNPKRQETPEYLGKRNVMKKLFVLTAGILLSASAMKGQDFQKYKIAFKMNPNVAWLTPQDNHITNEGSVVRFGFGANVDIHFTQNYAIGTGLNIDNAGGDLSYFEEVFVDDIQYVIEKQREYNLKYVEVPVTLKLRTNEIGYITYWGQFGLGFGVNVSAKADDRDANVVMFDEDLSNWVEADGVIEDEQINIKDDIRTLKAALVIGGGIEYNVSGSTSIVAGITFNNGFTNALDGEGVERKTDDSPFIQADGPKKFDLKANPNYLALNIGILF